MAELPEIYQLAKQMNEALKDKEIKSVEILQEKCTNLSQGEWNKQVSTAKVKQVYNKGKWICLVLSNDKTILISLGMGGDLIYFKRLEEAEEKFQVRLTFFESDGFTIKFWWFGKFILSQNAELEKERHIKDIGLHFFDDRVSLEYFKEKIHSKRCKIKTFLMDQKNISGIGNMYMHDILFISGIHPDRNISDLTNRDIKKLYEAIQGQLRKSLAQGTFAYEKDFYGNKGCYTEKDFFVGYKGGQPCPKCGTPIEMIKTGSTKSFICPSCQPLKKQNKDSN